MRVLSVCGIPLRLHPAMALFLIVALITARLRLLCLAFLLVFLHELAHCVAARLVGVRVTEIELAPFGCVARMEDLEERPGRECLVALAGPFMNLLLSMFACLLCHLLPQLSPTLASFILLNLCLCLFNLLPALPLDGGRVLRAALSPLLGRTRADRTAAVLGLILAAGMAALSIFLCVAQKRLNATLFLSGLYIGLCAFRSLKTRPFARAQELLALERQSLLGGALPVRVLAVAKGTPAREVLRHFAPGRLHYVLYLDADLRITAARWQSEILRAALGRAADKPEKKNTFI